MCPAIKLKTDLVDELGDFVFGNLAIEAFVKLYEEVSAPLWISIHGDELLREILGGQVAFPAGDSGPDVACILVPSVLITFSSRYYVV